MTESTKVGGSREVKTSGLLTREIVDRVEELIAERGFIAHVAVEFGVHPQRLHEWVRRGEREGVGIYHDFSIAVAKGRARAEAEELKSINSGVLVSGEHDWKARAWKLEKMNPAVYGSRSTTVNVAPLDRLMKLVEAEALDEGSITIERLYELGIAALTEEV